MEMKEAAYYNGIVLGANSSGKFTLYRIQDGSVDKKPFDIGGITVDGRGVAIEVKKVEKQPVGKLMFSVFASHQVTWLKIFSMMGGVSFAILADNEKVVAYRLFNEMTGSDHFGLSTSVQLTKLSNGAYYGLHELITSP